MSDYLSPQGCAIGTCDGGAAWGREQVIMNCLETFLETHIPLAFFMFILFSEAKKIIIHLRRCISVITF
jgi:hypothetical protein